MKRDSGEVQSNGRRLTPAERSPSFPPSTTTSEPFEKCHQWLEHNQVSGLRNVEFRSSEWCRGYGCYAKQDYQIGDVIFEIPQQECLYGFQNTLNTLLTKVILKTARELNLERILSSELILWLHMIEQRLIPSLPFHSYFSSLSLLPPTIDNWCPVDHLVFLEGTNLDSTLSNDPLITNDFSELLERIWLSYKEEIEKETEKDKEDMALIMQRNPFTLLGLRWARGHYLSRRYPERLHTPLHDEAKQFRQSLSSPMSDEQLLYGQMGVMVPLLDILNHNDEQEWLELKVGNGKLQIICNYPVKRVSSSFLISSHLSLCLSTSPLSLSSLPRLSPPSLLSAL
jgi:hypothetical protein